MGTTQVSIKRMDKAVVVYMHRLECMYTMEYYPAIKKESLPFVTTRINLRGITLSEVRERQILFDELTYTWNLKTTTTTNPQTLRNREQVCGCKSWVWGGATG